MHGLIRMCAVFIAALIATTVFTAVVTPTQTKTPGHTVAAVVVTEGSELHHPSQGRRNPMSTTVQPASDNTNPDEMSWEQYRAEFLPQLQPDSAAFALQHRSFHDEILIEKEKLVETLYPERSAPTWSEPDEFRESSLPCNSYWMSTTAHVRLRREAGQRFDATRSAYLANLNLTLHQPMGAREPYLHVAKAAYKHSAEGIESSRLFTATLDEAVELAHLLLLFVDAARESEQAGA